MCAAGSLTSLVPLRLRGFFAVAARRGILRSGFFFVATGAPDSGEG